MTQHPSITPPPELVEQWWDAALHNASGACIKTQLCTQAAQWGANQELDACVAWLDDTDCEDPREVSLRLRWHRRPKPPSLKEQAFTALKNSPVDPGDETLRLSADSELIIRRALDALDD